jgi:hypothetical protein
MKQLTISIVAFVASASTAQAACYADYKAKQDDPLRLHYGVAEVSGDCTVENATTQLPERIAGDDWQLLTVLGVFEDAGLDERRDSAGDYYLRY